MKTKRWPIICALIAVCLLTTHLTAEGQSMTFRHFGRAEELSDRRVMCIEEDSLGFLWVGTKLGLNRLEGHCFRSFYKGTSGLTSNNINDLLQGGDSRLWIATAEGLCVYDHRTGVIEPFTCSQFCIKEEIFLLCRDRDNNCWAMGKHHFYCISPDGRHNRKFACNDFFTPTYILSTRSGDLWMSALDGTLRHYNYKTHTFDTQKVLEEEDKSGLNFITAMTETADGQILLATRIKGCRLFSPLNGKVEKLFTTDASGQAIYIHCAMTDHKGQVWLGTETGVHIWGKGKGLIRNEQKDALKPNALVDNAVHALFQDHSDGIWVGTYFGGLCYSGKDTSRFRERIVTDDQEKPVGNAVREMSIDNNGHLWVTTEDCGLCLLENEDSPLTTLSLKWMGKSISHNVQTVMIDGTTAWVGTFNEGIYLIDTQTRQVIEHFTSGDGSELPDIAAVHIIKTRKGDILVAMSNGLCQYTGNGHFQLVKGLETGFIHSIFEASDGTIWVASLTHGLYRLATKGTQLEAVAEDIELYNLTTIDEDIHRGLIIGTHDNGFHFYNPLTHTLSDPLLPNHGICRIIKDGFASYWITTTRGLFRYTPTDGSFTAFHIADGLTSDQFSLNSGYANERGHIYVGTMAGMVDFSPQELEQEKNKPQVFFVMLEPEGRSLLFTDEITLEHNASITIEAATTCETAIRSPWFRYRLEGTSADWTVTQDVRAIKFYDLSPGDYVLHLQASNENGNWPQEERLLHIHVRQPWWWTWTARTCYLLLLAAVATVFHQTYLRRRRLQQRLAQEQIDAVRYREVLQSKINFFTAITHEIRTPLTLITGSLQRLRQRGVKEDVDVMQRNTDRLLGLVNQLLDFRKIESSSFLMNYEEVELTALVRNLFQNFQPLARQRKVDYHLRTTEERPVVVLADREALTKIISNLCSNALKFCDRFVAINLSVSNHQVRLSVSNDGPLVPSEQVQEIFKPFHQYYGTSVHATINGSGLGLSLARSLAEMHNGTLTYNLQDRRHNTFVLTLQEYQPVSLPSANGDGMDEPSQTDEAFDQKADAPTTEAAALARKEGHKSESKPTVLLVDDERDMRQFVSEELATTYIILQAENGEEALHILRQKEVLLVVTDLMMPVMDGIALCQAIRDDVSLCHIPIVVLTAKVSLQDHINALNCGADAYIEKPFSTEQLLAQIANLLHSRELLRQTFVRSPYAQPANVTANVIDRQFLTRLNEHISQHLTDTNLNVESVAEKMNMSASTFYRKVKAVTSLSPLDYIRLCRLKRGAELLAEGGLRVKEVADRLGFSSSTHFATSFMRQFGMTPSDFIRASKSKDASA